MVQTISYWLISSNLTKLVTTSPSNQERFRRVRETEKTQLRKRLSFSTSSGVLVAAKYAACRFFHERRKKTNGTGAPEHLAHKTEFLI